MNSELNSEQTGYAALQGALGTGPGELTLDASPKNYQLVAAQRGPVPSTVYIPSESMASSTPYYAPQYNYRQYSPPVKTSDTKPILPKQNVIVKEGTEGPARILKQFSLVFLGLVICGVPLGVVGTLYAQQKANSAINTTATVTATSVTLPSQCTTYTTNTDSTRNIASGSGALGDNNLVAGWYRFMSPAGTQITTTTVSRDTCTTYYGGSFSGTMPSTAGTTTYGTMCFNNNGQLCYASYSGTVIGVTNCNGYYVYYLTPLPQANSRYCTTG